MSSIPPPDKAHLAIIDEVLLPGCRSLALRLFGLADRLSLVQRALVPCLREAPLLLLLRSLLEQQRRLRRAQKMVDLM
jgi:hypothetical protein